MSASTRRVATVSLALMIVATTRAHANGPMPLFLGSPPYYSARPDPEALVVFQGEPLPFRIIIVGERDRSLPIWTSGPDAVFMVAFVDASGQRSVAGCVKWDRIEITNGKKIDRVDPAAEYFEVPFGGQAEAIVSVVPCSGELAPGNYVLWLASSSRALVHENERPSVFDRKTLEYRGVPGLAEELDKLSSRVAALMMSNRWEDADREADAALRGHPTCTMLSHFKAVIAEERQNWSAAIAATQQAISLIERRADALLFEVRGERDAADMLRTLRKDLDRLRAGVRRKQ